MTRAHDVTNEIMSWIETNYYIEMHDLLTEEGYTCTPLEGAPFYETNCPRATAMGIHNEALTRLLDRLERDKSLGTIVGGTVRYLLKKKYFSERDIQRETERAAARGVPA